MKIIRLTAILAVILMISAAFTTVTAQGMWGPDYCRGNQERGMPGMHARGHGPDRGPGMHAQNRRSKPPMIPPPHVLEDLGATEDQIQALEDLKFSHRSHNIDLRSRMEKSELALERLTRNVETSERDLLKAADTVVAARGELFKQKISMRYKVRRILGEELFEKIHKHRKPGDRPLEDPGPE